jgi:hypothetical protein
LQKLALSFGSFIEVVPWYPFLIAWLLSLYVIFRENLLKSNHHAKIVFFISVCALFSRIIMGKTAERYELYVLPAILFSVGFILFDRKINLSKQTSIIIIIFCICSSGYLFKIASVQNDSLLIQRDAAVRNWIDANTKPLDKIYLWNEGYDIYYLSDRKMATRFFSAEEDLDKVKLWKATHYRNTEYLWNIFLSDISTERPAYIIDLTYHFSQSNGMERHGIHKKKYDEFMSWISHNYTFMTQGQLTQGQLPLGKHLTKIPCPATTKTQNRKENEHEVFRVFIRNDLLNRQKSEISYK